MIMQTVSTSPERAPDMPASRPDRKSSGPTLSARHRLMIDYMVHGLHHETLRSRLPARYMPAGVDAETGAPLQKLGRPECHEALTLEDAAAACNVRPRAARYLAKQRVFQRLLAEETAAFRDGAKARAWRRIDALAHDPGAGSAADRKVMLAASQIITGENDGSRGTSVNINMPGSQQIVAGIVIRLPPGTKQTPLERAQTPSIEHEENP